LVLSGPPGTGKSHLASGLAFELHRRRPEAVLSHLLAAEYARELAYAVDTQAVREWENRYRMCDLLIVEDLDHLAAKTVAQEHLARTIDVLLGRGAGIVVTCSTPPSSMPHLISALRSRLSSGLVVPLVLPSVETRKRILERLIGERRSVVSGEAIQLLAEGIRGSVRDLVGALLFLEVSVRNVRPESAESPTIGPQEISEYLANRQAQTTPSMTIVASRTAKHFSVRLNQLRGPSRQKSLAYARNLAIYLARQLTGQSFEKIGAYFGGRDHTTAMHACRRMTELAERDPETQHALAELRAQLNCS
jgi:chromosomal replication initiator protein